MPSYVTIQSLLTLILLSRNSAHWLDYENEHLFSFIIFYLKFVKLCRYHIFYNRPGTKEQTFPYHRVPYMIPGIGNDHFFGSVNRESSNFSSGIWKFGDSFREAGLTQLEKLMLDSASALFNVPHFSSCVVTDRVVKRWSSRIFQNEEKVVGYR